ncbi:MAG: thiolase family protein [Sterolibacterium sp.]|nr:thiolase family protein [Sterolibacterium sp.]
MSAWIPYGCYWTTPFAKWQGSFANLHAMRFAAHVTKAELQKRNIAPESIDYGVLGWSVPQVSIFYGMPWFTGLIGAGATSGPSISQACATSVRCLLTASDEITAQRSNVALVQCCDRLSNGPHLYYPNPRGPGGTGEAEDWVMDSFAADPLTGKAMVITAENVAKRHGFTTEQQHEVVLMREAQYALSCADDNAFLKRYMPLPFEVPDARFAKVASVLNGDEGLTRSDAAGLAKLRPATPGGTVTFGGQTHPADANAAMIVTGKNKARELSRNAKIGIRIAGFGQSRVELAYMPEAPVPAAQRALQEAGWTMANIDAIKTHNPFAVNDLYFAKTTGFPLERLNNFGCSLVYGHPQAPMGLRGVMELIEELVLKGGGKGLFTGCAAGDSAMAIAIEVTDA